MFLMAKLELHLALLLILLLYEIPANRTKLNCQLAVRQERSELLPDAIIDNARTSNCLLHIFQLDYTFTGKLHINKTSGLAVHDTCQLLGKFFLGPAD